MLHEEWVMEALQLMGDLAKSIRDGLICEGCREHAIQGLQVLFAYWSEWTAAVTGDDKMAVLERAEQVGIFADDRPPMPQIDHAEWCRNGKVAAGR